MQFILCKELFLEGNRENTATWLSMAIILFTPQPLAVWGIVVICAGGQAVGGQQWAASGGRQTESLSGLYFSLQCTNSS